MPYVYFLKLGRGEAPVQLHEYLADTFQQLGNLVHVVDDFMTEIANRIPQEGRTHSIRKRLGAREMAHCLLLFQRARVWLPSTTWGSLQPLTTSAKGSDDLFWPL